MKVLNIALVFAAALTMAGCKEDYDKYDNSGILHNKETMTLEASSLDLKLDVDKLDDVALTFKWTPAREVSDDYIQTYVTMLDLKTNEFNASSVIRVVEDDGVFEKSYTNDELQQLIVGKWGKSISEVTTISFKVISKWDGGDKFIMPETRTVNVDVQPYRPVTFDADKVFLDGPAVKSVRPSSNYTMTKTPESDFVYAGEFEMKAGRMLIPIEYDGVTRYIVASSRETVDVPDADLLDGKPAPTEAYSAVVMDLKEGQNVDDLPAWNLPSDGFWRVIIDMENKNVQFYSPKNRLEPLSVEYDYSNGSGWVLRQTIDAGKYYVNTMTGWDNWKGKPYEFVQSQIDPQRLYCLGVSIKPDAKFCIKIGQSIKDRPTEIVGGDHHGRGNDDPNTATGMQYVSKSWAFVPAGNVDSPLEMNKWMDMLGAVSNRKWTFESNAKPTITKISIDLRNNKIRFD